MTCTHQRYKQGGYLTADNALKAMKVNAICWMGISIKECADCGADLSEHHVVPVLTAEEYLKQEG